MEGLSSAISGKASAVKSAMTSVLNGAKNALNSLGSSLKSKASSAMNLFNSALRSGAGAARSAVSSVMNAAKGAVGNIAAHFRNVGRNIVQGFVNGISSLLGSVTSIAARLGGIVSKIVKDKNKVKSPSRLFMEIGGYIGEGYAIGLEKSIPMVSKSAEELADVAPDVFSDTLKSLSINMDDLLETDYNPVITPVIDPTQFDSDMTNLTTLLNNRMPDNFNVGAVNYSQQFAAKLADYADVNKQAMEAFANNAIDYDQLGVSVANALIRSGVHVEMDGGQLMGYLAGEIRDARRMYG